MIKESALHSGHAQAHYISISGIDFFRQHPSERCPDVPETMGASCHDF